MDHTLTKRGFGRVGKTQKRVLQPAESAASKGGGLGVFITPLEKLVIFIAVAIPCIPNMSGMTYIAPTVTKLQ